MKKLTILLCFLGFGLQAAVFGPVTTPYTRTFLKVTDAAAARNNLGVYTTNGTISVGYVTEAMLAGAVTNAWKKDITNATVNTVFIQTNTLVCPAGLITGGYLWNSNQVLYWVTSTKTNLLSNGR